LLAGRLTDLYLFKKGQVMQVIEKEDSSALYFIVGGLVVLALIFAFIYMGNNTPDFGTPDRVVERTTTNNTTEIVPVPATPESTTTETNTTNYNFGTEAAE
jgi:hypothetical protein